MSASSLATRPLGRTDMTITRVGFGAWAIGGGDWSFAWGHQDDDESVAAIRYAVDAGVNWIDTASVYGLGHSEEVVARAVKAIQRVQGLPEDDWRRRNPDFQGEALAANLSLAAALRPIAARHGVTPAAVAVAWTLAWPGVTAAIVGARRPEQIDGWLPAATLTLDDDDLTAIAEAIAVTGAGTGPADPRQASLA